MNESTIHMTFKDINDSNFKKGLNNYISNEPENINNLENFTNSWSMINKVHNSNINTSNPVYFNQNVSPNDLDSTGEWELAADYLSEAGIKVKLAGADFLVICTNTMHKVAEKIESQTGLPLLHIADATGERITKTGFTKVGLLGTAFTMEQSFYKDRLINKFNLEVLTPNAIDRKIVHDIIYQELCLGVINKKSKKEYKRIMAELVSQGAEGIILGCTEITLLVDKCDTNVCLFDTTAIHAQKAIEVALDI